MATPKTVFLLGAGASQPYGLPLGSELKVHLLNLSKHGTTKTRLQELRISNEAIGSFVETLQYGPFSTLDELLDVKKKYREIGSYLLAETILSTEKHDNLFPSKDWYKTLFEKLDFSNESRIPQDVAFVTLNYDRSLEHFLGKSVDYGLRDEDEDQAHVLLKELAPDFRATGIIRVFWLKLS